MSREGLMKLNKMALALSGGIMWGATVFLATIFLLLTGGQGETLSKLNAFYFGYSFSYLGSIVGLLWGFVDGFVVGWLFGLIYNAFAKEK